MTENNNIREREKIAREIEKTSESICKKHRVLKIGKIEDDITVKTCFKPIIELLQKIVDSSNMRAKKMNWSYLMMTLKHYPFKSARRMQNKTRGNDRISRWIANLNTWALLDWMRHR